MATIYISKTEDANEYAKLGYNLSIDAMQAEGHTVVFKPIIFSRDNDIVKELIDNFNSDWNIAMRRKKMAAYFKKKGIEFECVYDDKTGNKVNRVIQNDALYSLLCNWRIEIDLSEDKFVCFTAGDYYFHLPYFCDADKAIDKYCKNEIKELLDAGLVMRFETETQEQKNEG